MKKILYRPTDIEISTLIQRVKEYYQSQNLSNHDIYWTFESYDKAWVKVNNFEHRFELTHGRWTCTRGPWD